MGHGAKFSVERKGPGLVATLQRIRREVASSSVKVGVFGSAKEQNGKSDSKWAIGVVELAVIHEYGAPRAHIPARSFIASTIQVNREAYAALVRKLLEGVYHQRISVRQGLELLGLRVSADCKRRIELGEIKQDLAPSTLAAKLRKGSRGKSAGASPKALIETGRLKNSITYQVEMGEGGGE